MRPALAGLLLVAVLAAPLRAQPDSATALASPVRPASAVVRWGKWAAAAAAVGFTVAGLRQHNDADHAFAALVGYCGTVATCSLDASGRYANATAEATYQRVVRGDRAARAWLVAGQLATVGTAALFVIDLLHAREPRNIPFSGLFVESDQGMTRVGMRILLR